jgi:hypothetical protein
VGINTIHDGLSQSKRRLAAVFQAKSSKKHTKGQRSQPF